MSIVAFLTSNVLKLALKKNGNNSVLSLHTTTLGYVLNKNTCNEMQLKRNFNYFEEELCFHVNIFYVFLKKIGGHKSYLWATNMPDLDFWWSLLWVSKPEWAALFVLGRGICYLFPEIHLWCNTSRPLGGHHCISWQIALHLNCSLPHTCEQALVGLDLSCHCSHCETRQTLYRLSCAGSAIFTGRNEVGPR